MFHRFLSVALVLVLGALIAHGQGDKKEPPKQEPREGVKIDVAKAQIKVLTIACDAYRLKNRENPPSLQALLDAKPPYLESKDVLIDPWGNKYQYDLTGPKNSGRHADIWTVTPSKQILGNWPQEKEAKKEQPKKVPGTIDVDEFIKKLPANLPKEQVDRIRTSLEQANKRMQEAQKRMDELKRRPLPNIPDRRGALSSNRLGVRLEKPSDTLIAQLGLPAGKGQVLAEVKEGSAAAKAGLMANDILLELAGKDVSSDQAEFVKALGEIKKDTPIDAVVLRMGKRETIKGITLPDAPATRGGGLQLPRRPDLDRKRANRTER
jgi:hypothetical protein